MSVISEMHARVEIFVVLLFRGETAVWKIYQLSIHHEMLIVCLVEPYEHGNGSGCRANE